MALSASPSDTGDARPEFDDPITSPFAIRAEVRGGKFAFMQFMEDTFGTAASSRSGGAWTFRTFPGGDEVAVTEPPQ